ncbi:hypothetical protein IHC92_17605 [Photobacterium damselae subsp. damselae]|nr:hypothetical protein [Photobacterium damselae]UKA08820.1 hypothetical protein IHC90_17590 [Photobacterium damselae subsp. damselae]UKA23977.1 hypothetical protein IHC92_17605 [Photobacterium damselae subsp. damselae]
MANTQGMTVVDRYNVTGKNPNAKVLFGLNREGFVDLLVESLEHYNK